MAPRAVRLARALLLAAGVAASVGLAAAQPSGAPGAMAGGAGAPAPATRPDRNSVEVRAAAAIARVAMADLKMNASPTARDYAVAAEILKVAHSVAPDDQDVLRLLIEACTGAGDDDGVERHSRTLMRLDPADTVTLLRVVSGAINRSQNADARMAAYERFLSESGAAIDASVRSRLALDAALLAREQGDLEMFERRLNQALELDSSNKDAATLALTFFAGLVDDPAGRLDMLLNVLLADPFDDHVHLGIARELARSGAYRGATRFFNNAFALAAKRGFEVPSDVRDEASVVDWIVRGADAYVRDINEQIATARGQVTRQREQAALMPEPPERMPDPAEVRLPLELERLRILAASALGDAALIDGAVAEMADTVARSKAAVQDLRLRPKELTEADVAEIVRALTVESIWLRLWAGRELNVASTDFEDVRRNPNTDPKDVERMEAWLRLRYAEFDEAERRLRAMEGDSLAVVGLAVLSDMKGLKAEAIERYSEIARRLPASPAGAFAFTRAQVLSGRGTGLEASAGLALTPPASARLESTALGVPNWLERMFDNPLEFMTLRADLIAGPEGRIGLFDKVGIRLRLRNVARVPLGVGPDRPINSRLLSVPSMRFGTVPVRRQSLNGVVSLDQRLRLLPREELIVELWPDNGLSGLTIQEDLRRSVNVTWRLLQGFTPGDGGVFDAGPFCLSADAGPAVRPAMDAAFLRPAELVERARRGTGMELAEIVLVIRDMWAAPEEIRFKPEDSSAIFAEVVRRFPTLEKAERLLILATAPQAWRMPAIAAIDEVASRDRDSDVQTFLVAARIATPDHPLLNETLWNDNPGRVQLIRMVKQRLVDGVSTYARPVGGDEDSDLPGGAPISGGAAGDAVKP